KESFERQDVADLMNDAFISIKVDREELPEIDGLYMEFAQGMMAGSLGWPLNIILTPDLQPFFAVTYLPTESRRGLTGLLELVPKIKKMWEGEEREEVIDQAFAIVEMFAKSIHAKGTLLPEKEQIEDAAELLFKMADPVFGGIKGAPKFPIAYQLDFLLRYSLLAKDSRSLFLVERTLDMMHRGGIYDHLGGGFSRYSTDEEWLVPHFEKMLSDNALLASSYLQCWLVTKKESYQEICKEILDYALREMRSSKGAFYSAEDADSEGQEGKYYTWELSEFQNILGPEKSAFLVEYFGVSAKGNFHGRNILHTSFNLNEFAEKKNLNLKSATKKVQEEKSLLLSARQIKEHPFKDDKILVSWNALMIATLIEAGLGFQEKRYLDAGLEAANFIKNVMWQDGQLFRRYRDQDVRFFACLEDYALMIRACLELFEADLGTEWLKIALEMTTVLEENFKEPGGAFYQTDGKDPNIILKKCRFADGAEPSGNAIHCENLIKLYQLTSEVSYLEQAEDILCASKKYLDNYPPGYIYHVMNLNKFYDKKAALLVIALDKENTYKKELEKEIYSQFIPHKAVIWRHLDEKDLFRLIPYVKDLIPLEERTTLYICFEGVCQKPINQLSEMKEAIGKL
ncbi:MAG TPA: thioredoxin domain-containing protein, partial [Parachlamydiaceae bacterium]|nr:thioredoxin domain-containing protein [Parachlamydiaceae bacterium]